MLGNNFISSIFKIAKACAVDILGFVLFVEPKLNQTICDYIGQSIFL